MNLLQIYFLLLSTRVVSFSTNDVFMFTNQRYFGSKSRFRTISNDLYAAPKDKNWLMDDFKTADGKIIDPYMILKVDHDAPRLEIRASYRKLSKKYHPDAVRFRKIMPGKCDTLEEVRDEWERIKLSYEILSDKKLRLKYDRQSALNNPGKALGRAAIGTVSWGVTGIAKGIFSMGKQAVSAATRKKKEEDKKETSTLVKIERKRRRQRMKQKIKVELNSTSYHNMTNISQ